MPFTLPSSLASVIAFLVAVVLTALLLRHGKADLKRTAVFTVVGVWLWFAAAQFLSRRGLFQDSSAFQPGDLGDFLLFNTLFSLPVVVLAVLWFRVERFRRLTTSLSVAALVGLQFYRIGGAAYLEAGIDGTLPAYMGYTTGWLDITVGVTAIVVALGLATGQRWRDQQL